MKKIAELYCNYGCLNAGKRTLYSHGTPIDSAVVSEKITVKFPDKFWDDGWTVSENETGEQLLCSPWGWNYLWNDVLQGNQTPCIYVIDKNGKDHRYILKKCEDLHE